MGFEHQRVLNYLQGQTNTLFQKGNIFFPRCLKQVYTIQGFTPNKNLLNKTGCFTSWMQSTDPFPQDMIFSGRNSELCKKKKKVRSYKNRKLLQVILMEPGTEGWKEAQEHANSIYEKYQLVATCGTHKLNIELYYSCWFTQPAGELVSETEQENNAYPNVLLHGISRQPTCTIREKFQEKL